MNSALFLLTIIVIVLGFPMVCNYILSQTQYRESFKGYAISMNPNSLGSEAGSYPGSLSKFALHASYPLKTQPGISGTHLETASKMWWHYPIFKESSYKQITNNLKHYKNPDIGTCTPSVMCGTIYKDKKNLPNYVTPLPPVNSINKTRVGYFATSTTPFE